MTTTELKTEINKALENIPEEALTDALLYLQQILTEDAELLEKLAQ